MTHEILHVLGLEMTFWDDFQMILHGFAPRNPKNMLKQVNTYIFILNLGRRPNKYMKNKENLSEYRLVEAPGAHLPQDSRGKRVPGSFESQLPSGFS